MPSCRRYASQELKISYIRESMDKKNKKIRRSKIELWKAKATKGICNDQRENAIHNNKMHLQHRHTNSHENEMKMDRLAIM